MSRETWNHSWISNNLYFSMYWDFNEDQSCYILNECLNNRSDCKHQIHTVTISKNKSIILTRSYQETSELLNIKVTSQKAENTEQANFTPKISPPKNTSEIPYSVWSIVTVVISRILSFSSLAEMPVCSDHTSSCPFPFLLGILDGFLKLNLCF